MEIGITRILTMKKSNFTNILLFITAITLSINCYSTAENYMSGHNNSNIVVQTIKEEFNNLCNKVVSLNEVITNFDSPQLQDEFNNKIQSKSKPVIVMQDKKRVFQIPCHYKV